MTTTTDRLSLRWGWDAAIPDGCKAAWGARLIVTQDGHVDRVPDRVGPAKGNDPVAEEHLFLHLDRVVKKQPFEQLKRMLEQGIVRTSADAFGSGAMHTVYADRTVVARGTTNGSGGYFYLTIYLRPAPDTHAMRVLTACDDANVYADVADWAADSDYRLDPESYEWVALDAPAKYPDGYGPVDIDAAYLEAKAAELAALEADFVAMDDPKGVSEGVLRTMAETFLATSRLRTLLYGTHAEQFVLDYPGEPGIMAGDAQGSWADQGTGASGFYHTAVDAGFESIDLGVVTGLGNSVAYTLISARDGSRIRYIEGDLYVLPAAEA